MHILLIIAVIVGIIVAVIALRPSQFSITRALVMRTPTSDIFPHVNDLHLWNAWSPWAKLDPHAHSVFEGPPSGMGAIMRWAGSKKVGKGSMEITKSVLNDHIIFRLDFLEPFKSTNKAEFRFTPQGDGTIVTWSMNGKNGFMGKAIGLVMNCDKMVGAQFEQGLTDLKTIVEA